MWRSSCVLRTSSSSSSAAVVSSSSSSFVPPRLNSGLEVQFASKLFGDCLVSGKRANASGVKSCHDVLVAAVKALAISRGKAVPETLRVGPADAKIVFGAVDLLRKAGEWARAIELLAATHRGAEPHTTVQRDALLFYSSLAPLSSPSPSSSSSRSGDSSSTSSTAGQAESAPSDATSFSKWDASVVHLGCEKVTDESIAALERSVRSAQRILREQERHVYFQASKSKQQQHQQPFATQNNSGAVRRSIDAETQVRIERKRRAHHAEFAAHFGHSLQLASEIISAVTAASAAAAAANVGRGTNDNDQEHQQQQQHPNSWRFNHRQRRLQRQQRGVKALPVGQRTQFLRQLAALADMCTRSHALQAAIAEAAAATASKNANITSASSSSSSGSSSPTTIVLSPTRSQSVWHVDPYWPMLSFDVITARLLLEVPDVLRSELSLSVIIRSGLSSSSSVAKALHQTAQSGSGADEHQLVHKQTLPSDNKDAAESNLGVRITKSTTAAASSVMESSSSSRDNPAEGFMAAALRERDKIEDMLDQVLSSSGDEIVQHHSDMNDGAEASENSDANDTSSSSSTNNVTTATNCIHDSLLRRATPEQKQQWRRRQFEIGRLFFRAALVEPQLSSTALRTFQFHSNREVFDTVLQCVSAFITGAAMREESASSSSSSSSSSSFSEKSSSSPLHPGRSVVVDDTHEVLDRISELSSSNSSSLWPFLHKLLEVVHEGDNRALYVKKDKRLSTGGFTEDWMRAGPDSYEVQLQSQQERQHLEYNAARFLVIVDLVCDLAWQSVGAVVCGKMTINAARSAAVPTIRLACEIAAHLPVLDVTKTLPLIFVAAQGLGISAWEGNLKLPLARFLWFVADDERRTAELVHRVLQSPTTVAGANNSMSSLLPLFDWNNNRFQELEPRRASWFCRAVFSQLQRQRKQRQQQYALSSSAARAKSKSSGSSSNAPTMMSAFGSAVLPSTPMWQKTLAMLAPLTQANGFTPLHQKLALVACADARQWAVGLTLFTHHCRSVPATQASVALLLDFIRHSPAKDPGARAIHLVVESHIVNNSGDAKKTASNNRNYQQSSRESNQHLQQQQQQQQHRPTPAVMLRLCRLVALSPNSPSPRATHDEISSAASSAMRFFSSLAREGALGNAIENCGPKAFAPFLTLSASRRGGGWQDAAFVLSTMIQRRRFFEMEQLAPLLRPESQIRSRWKEMLRCFSVAAASSAAAKATTTTNGIPFDQENQYQAMDVSPTVAAAFNIALAAAHDAAACRAVIRHTFSAATAASGKSRQLTLRVDDLRQPASNLRSNMHALCADNDEALATLEQEILHYRQ